MEIPATIDIIYADDPLKFRCTLEGDSKELQKEIVKRFTDTKGVKCKIIIEEDS